MPKHIALIPLFWDIVILWVYIFVHINIISFFLCVQVYVCARACVYVFLLYFFLCIISFLSSYKYIYHNIIYLCLLMAKSMFSADFANKL